MYRIYDGYKGGAPSMSDSADVVKTCFFSCPFCAFLPERIILSNQHGLAIRDGYPVSPGHTLIIPRRHTESFFGLDSVEISALFVLLEEAKTGLDEDLHPAGYNIGINDGSAAGQTVPHVHIHLIPRFVGDVPDPRGGVRWILPEKADYWT